LSDNRRYLDALVGVDVRGSSAGGTYGPSVDMLDAAGVVVDRTV
jgi:hypothetical protein